jgi:putative hemolysin
MMLIPVLVVGGLLLMAGGAGAKGKRRAPTPGPTPTPTTEEAEAIIFCESEGGATAPMEDANGNVYFICTFGDGRMVDAMAYYRGEAAPSCPVEMTFDPETQTCVLTGAPIEPPVDPNFEVCMGALLEAWIPLTAHLNIPLAVATNLYTIMRMAAEDEWAPYTTPEALADFGMVHVVPECDWLALRQYVREYTLEYGVVPGHPDDVQKGTEVYTSVLQIAQQALKDASIGFDVHPAPPKPDIHQQPGPQPPKPNIQKKCPPNYFYDALHDVCCPDGFFWHVGDQMCRPEGYGGRRKRSQGNTKAHRVDLIRNGFAGGCAGRRGHCGVRRRAA